MSVPYNTIRYDNEADWVAGRNEGIGGSDVAVILGKSDYKSPYMLWQEKTGLVEVPDISDKPAVEWGQRLEDVVAKKFADNHPEYKVTKKNATLVSKARPWARADIDRCLTTEDRQHGVLEIKTASSWRKADWDGGVPAYYLPQPTHYLSVTGWDFMWVAVLIGGQDYREYYFERDDDKIAEQDKLVDAFWNDYVIQDTEPPLTDLDQAAFSIKPLPKDDIVELPLNSDIEKLYTLKKQISDLTRARKSIEANLLRDMGNHSHAHSGMWDINARQSMRESVDYAAYEKDHPGCFDDYKKTTQTYAGLYLKQLKE